MDRATSGPTVLFSNVNILSFFIFLDMNLVAFLSIVFMVSSANADIVRNNQLNYGNFAKMKGFVLRGNPMATITQPGTNGAACATACIETPGCESYNYGPKSETCSLMATDHYKNASSLEALSNHDYYYRAVS